MSLTTRYAALVADRKAEQDTTPAYNTPVSEGKLADTILNRWDVLKRAAEARYPRI
jgi:hypothetical protein